MCVYVHLYYFIPFNFRSRYTYRARTQDVHIYVGGSGIVSCR